MERSVMSKRDLLLIGSILLIALLFSSFFLLKQSSAACVAALSIDGTIVETYNLSQEENRLIDLREPYAVPIILEIQDGAICFHESVCPDHICENYGFISREGETAVCMPNCTVLTIYAANDNLVSVQ